MHRYESSHSLITGPDGAGKTSLIEALLRSSRSRRLGVARLAGSDAGHGVSLERGGSEELARYERAGAVEMALIRCPRAGGYPEPVELRSQHGFGAACDAVIIEGWPNLSGQGAFRVLVARALRAGETVIRKQQVETMRIPLATYLGLLDGGQVGPPVGAEAEKLDEPDVEAEGEAVEIEGSEVLTDLSDRDGQTLLDWHRNGVPFMGERWRLHPHLQGLGRAQAVVINVRTPDERARGRALVAEIRRILRAAPTYREAFDEGSPNTRLSLFVADLADRRDPELAKLLVRIKRAFPPVRQAGSEDKDW